MDSVFNDSELPTNFSNPVYEQFRDLHEPGLPEEPISSIQFSTCGPNESSSPVEKRKEEPHRSTPWHNGFSRSKFDTDQQALVEEDEDEDAGM